MDQYSAMYHERKRREMEAEMNRFEQEISSQPVYNYMPQQSIQNQTHLPQSTVQFIPHAIQRQLPRSSHQQQQPQFDNSNFTMNMPSGNVNANNSSSSNTANNHVGYTITPMGMPTMTLQTPAGNTGQTKKKSSSNDKGKKQKKMLRQAGGIIWEDNTLMNDWDPDDFRIFCGDLGNDVTDDVLARAFNRFPTFQKAKVVRDKRTNKTKGYGFVSFKDPQDFARAMKEMNGKYVGSRPIKLRKSNWRDRNLDVVRKKHKEKAKLGLI